MKTTKRSKSNKPRTAGVKATRPDDAAMIVAPPVTAKPMPSDPRAAALNRIASLAQTLGAGDLLIEYRRQRKLCADWRRDASPALHQQLAMLDRWAVGTRQLDAMRVELRELVKKYMPKVYESLPMLANMQHWETHPDIDWESFDVEMRRVEAAAMDALDADAPPHATGRLMTVECIAVRIKKSEATVRRAIASGALVATTKDKLLRGREGHRVYESEVEKWIDAGMPTKI